MTSGAVKSERVSDRASEARRAVQPLLPVQRPAPTEHYDLYPAHSLPAGSVKAGFAALAAHLEPHRVVRMDGSPAVGWAAFRAGLEAALETQGRRVQWISMERALRPAEAIQALTAPFTGGDDPLFGTSATLTLEDWFGPEQLEAVALEGRGFEEMHANGLVVVYGPGAALVNLEGLLVYADVPKCEAQFRSRAGQGVNLGVHEGNPKAAYKRLYFVDWPVLRTHLETVWNRVDVFVDAQRIDAITVCTGAALRTGLETLARTVFRVRPWFEPGVWGGQWIKRQIPDLPQDAPNYAWSFELIVPENGVLFTSDGLLLECPFDLLMVQAGEAVLGEAFARFGTEFPIRFDWLDTVRGGNLSLQVHPSTDYIRAQFGERFTQDETYYLLHAEPEATVYLGFQDDIDPLEFRTTLEHSLETGAAVDVERFVQQHPARTGDLFLIPNGTVHCSGAGSLVLEISATPYIFTFKLYDWVRLDLEGKPRPLNLERGFDNLDFSRRGEVVQRELISQPRVLESGTGWRVVHLPTHPEHFYDVQRLEFSVPMSLSTEDQCHVMAVVAGAGVTVTVGGTSSRFAFAETFVVPAAAGRYTLTPHGEAEVQVVRAFVKPERNS
jgi:mannose-6-phosphate isomerase class I